MNKIKYGQQIPVAVPNKSQQESPADTTKESTPVQPNPIKSLEALMQNIIQHHYNRVYKELMSYEQKMIQQLQVNQQNKEPDVKN